MLSNLNNMTRMHKKRRNTCNGSLKEGETKDFFGKGGWCGSKLAYLVGFDYYNNSFWIPKFSESLIALELKFYYDCIYLLGLSNIN